MDYRGEKFLDKLFSNLYMSDEVVHTKNSVDNRNEAIRKYLERLERVHKNSNTETKKKLLESLYFKKYVIKEENIPNKYDKEDIINNQKKSLKMWLDYLSDETSSYPIWAKYWAFQGMLRMGTYDEAKEIYLKRDKKTMAPFVPANPEIIAKTIEVISQLVNDEKLPNDLEKEININDSFRKIYSLFEKKYKNNIVNRDNNDGIWIKYNKGLKEDALRLCKSIENKNTGWCTASESYAIKQVCGPYNDSAHGGDFYVYYTKDKDEKYTNPRIAIRLIDKYEIGEIRGINDGQNLEDEMIPVLEKKLNEMTFLKKEDVDKNLEIINGLKELDLIDKKTEKKIRLTDTEIANLYTKKYGFGWSIDPKVIKIRNKRNKKEDIQSITDESLLIYIISNNVSLADYIDFTSKKELLLEIIKKNSNVMSHINKELKNNKEFMLKAVKQGENVYNSKMGELRNDKEIIIAAVKKNGRAIEYVPSHLKNKQIMLLALKQDGYLYQYVPSYLQLDIDIILEAVRQNGNALSLMPDNIKNTRYIVLEAIKQNPNALRFASKRLQADKDIVLFTVKKQGVALQFASDELKEDREVVLESVKQNGLALTFASKDLRNDKEIVITAINQDPFALLFASDRLKNNKKIVSIVAHKNKYALKYTSKKLQNKFKNIS